MMKVIRIALILAAAGYYMGCNKVKFDKDMSADPCISATNCIHLNGRNQYTDSLVANMGKVDILFVDDNSGSMSFEQQKIADRFSSFIQILDAKNVDYRIAITTTDVSTPTNPARAINQNGALQNGKLIQFRNGSYFLSRDIGTPAERQAMFAEKIKRDETKICEEFVTSSGQSQVSDTSAQYLEKCPSGDERGIFAANLTIQDNPAGFIRSDAHLAIVILSDEDIRSSNYYKSNTFTLQNQDMPQTLINQVRSAYPNKTLAVHSLIVRPGALQSVTIDQLNVIVNDLDHDPVGANYNPEKYFQPGDDACLGAQSKQISNSGFSGSYGYLYAMLTRMTGGIEGSICADDYGAQLTDIGASIAEQVNTMGLRCKDIKDLQVTISPDAGVGYTLDGTTLRFGGVLSPGTRVTAVYTCPSDF